MSSEHDEQAGDEQEQPSSVVDPYETRPAPPDDESSASGGPPGSVTADGAGGEADDGGYPRPPTFVEPGGWSSTSYAESQADPEPEPAPIWEPASPAPQGEQPPTSQWEPPAVPQQNSVPQWEQPPAAPQEEQSSVPQWEQPPAAPQWEQGSVPQWEQPPAASQWEQGSVPQWEQPPAAPQWEQPQWQQPRGEQPRGEQSQWTQPPAAPAESAAPPAQPPTAPSTDLFGGTAPQQPQGGLPADLPPQPLPPQPTPAGHQPARQPRPEDLLVPTAVDSAAAPASWGWRGRINRGTGGLIKPKAAPAEIAAREAITRIQRSFSRPMTVVVVQPKGGAGKTPTTICLSAAFGAHRGGYVVGWDDNETRGTLAVRVRNPDNQQATVWDLLSDLDGFERSDARVGDLSYYVRAQPDAHFDALVSDDNPGNMAQIGDAEFNRLHRVLQRFYRMIVIDTGNNVRSANWQAAVNAADLVVVVSTYQRDVGFSASWVLDHLAQTGREELARNAVTVLTAADPTSDRQVRDELMQHFSQRTRAVVEIPYDPELAHGGPIGWLAMQQATRLAWVEAGATVADALSEIEQRALQARRA